MAGRWAETIVRVGAAIAVTAFIGWYGIDFAQSRGSTTVEFAAWCWVAMLGWLVVVIGILGIRADLGDRYHGASGFERSGRLYRMLGVPQAKRFMPNGDYAIRLLRHVRPGYRIVTGVESAARWQAQTRSKETGHVVHLALTLPLALYLLAGGAIAGIATVAVLDVVFDLYPVMVQRYNRFRIDALLESARRRRAEHPASAA